MQRALEQVPGQWDKISGMAIIADGRENGYLAIVGSHSVNGVAKMHTEILKKRNWRTFVTFIRISSTTKPTESPTEGGF